MKTFKFQSLVIMALSICAFFHACDKDEMTPITLEGIEGTTIQLIFPSSSLNHYKIRGGDGNYSVLVEKPEIISAKINPLTDISSSNLNLSMEAKGIGTTQVTIRDNAQNSLILNVTVDYLSLSCTVVKHDILISGNDLTENEKNAISDIYLAEIPVKVGGGYKFIFTDSDKTKGDVLVYTDKFGTNGIKTTFGRTTFDDFGFLP